MTYLFFPQWQGVGFDTDLMPAAHMLRAFMATRIDVPLSVWHEVELDASPTLDKAHGVIAHRAITSQLMRVKHLLSAQQAHAVFTLGGDCGLEVVPVSYLNRLYDGDLAVVWVDAHADLNTPQTSPSAAFHGMPLRVLLGEGDAEILEALDKTLTPKQVFMVGVREFDPPELAYVDAQYIPIFHPQRDAAQLGALVAAIQQAGFRRVYFHLDLDSLEPSEFPHVPFQTPDGLRVSDVVALANALSDAFQMVGMSITEYDSKTGEGLDTLSPILEIFKRWSNP